LPKVEFSLSGKVEKKTEDKGRDEDGQPGRMSRKASLKGDLGV
jgi:hypothetical protein